ncbi:MAG: hypothetical protein GQ574_20990 [Crocinitomix sp.]|nr:hypothetical protein [Crocinitomix sp.]
MPKFTVLISILLVLNHQVLACSCGTKDKVKEAIEQAEYVFYGKVIDTSFVRGNHWFETISSDSSEFPQDEMAFESEFLKTTFVIIHSFKGKSTLDTISIYTDESERSCGVAFQPGEIYVVYGESREYIEERNNHSWHPLKEPEEMGSIWTHLCTRTTKAVKTELAQIEESITPAK